MVKLFSKPDCPNCDKTKTVMNNLGIEYNEIDITKDASALKQVLALGYKAAPVVVSEEGESWAGYQRDRIESLASVNDLDDIFA